MATIPSQFTPKLITVIREGYTLKRFSADVIAGLTVAIVALPLAMGIGIASGSTPDRALFTAIVAGFIVSAFGGSRFQIGGPTAAFIVVVYRTIEHHGYDGLALATLMAGVVLLAAGFLRLGTYVKYVPYPVTCGFTAGIGVTIFVSQIADLLGLTTAKLPGDFIPKVAMLATALPSLTPMAMVLSGLAFAVILLLRHYRPKWPGLLLAVVLTSVLVIAFQIGVVTIGSKFGAIPAGLPMPSIPPISWAKMLDVAPDAATIALLAGIESLLSAVVADGMTGSRHRSNGELVAQGLANLASPFFGGMPATGALARTATNIRAGSTGPVSGILHAVFLLVFMIVAAPLMAYVPLACLAVILSIVAWNMSDVHVVIGLVRTCDWGDRFVLTGTFLLTVFLDLTVGITFGVVVSALLFMHRMADTVHLEANDDAPEAFDGASRVPQDVAVFRVNGPLFFGAASEFAAALQRVDTRPKRLILDLSAVPLVDATGASILKEIIASADRQGTEVILTAMSRPVMRSLVRHGVTKGGSPVHSAQTVADALTS